MAILGINRFYLLGCRHAYRGDCVHFLYSISGILVGHKFYSSEEWGLMYIPQTMDYVAAVVGIVAFLIMILWIYFYDSRRKK